MIGTIIDEESKEDKKKKVAQPWKQEVRDENGRRRLHGAFTGGFSAGYYNTVGSAEGWTPQQFVSSRASKRTSATELQQQQAAAAETSRSALGQKATDFMDQEDLEQFGLVEGLVARDEYDVLGGTAAELDRRRREQARSGSTATTSTATATSTTTTSAATTAKTASSAIPGFSPEQMVGTVSSGVGARLLRTMGWREGQGVGARQRRRKSSTTNAVSSTTTATSSLTSNNTTTNNNDDGDADPDAILETFQFAPDNVKIVEYDLKHDRRGIGFDPYKNAEIVKKARALQRTQMNADDDEHTHEGRRTRLSMANALTGRDDSKSMRGFGLGAFDNEDGDDDDADIYHQTALEAYDIDDSLEAQQNKLAQRQRVQARSMMSDSRSAATNRMLVDVVQDVDTVDDPNEQRCGDGRRPVRGFRVAFHRLERAKVFALPRVPPTYNGKHVFLPSDEKPSDLPTFRKQSTAAVRARLLSDPSTAMPPHSASTPSVGSTAQLNKAMQIVSGQMSNRFVSGGTVNSTEATTTTSSTNATPVVVGLASLSTLSTAMQTARAAAAAASNAASLLASISPPTEVTMKRSVGNFVPARLWCKRMNVADPLSSHQRAGNPYNDFSIHFANRQSCSAIDESALGRPASSLSSAAEQFLSGNDALFRGDDKKNNVDKKPIEQSSTDNDRRSSSRQHHHSSDSKFESGGKQIGDVELSSNDDIKPRAGLWTPSSSSTAAAGSSSHTTSTTSTTAATSSTTTTAADPDVLQKPSLDLFKAIFGGDDDNDDDDDDNDDDKTANANANRTLATSTNNNRDVTIKTERIDTGDVVSMRPPPTTTTITTTSTSTSTIKPTKQTDFSSSDDFIRHAKPLVSVSVSSASSTTTTNAAVASIPTTTTKQLIASLEQHAQLRPTSTFGPNARPQSQPPQQQQQQQTHTTTTTTVKVERDRTTDVIKAENEDQHDTAMKTNNETTTTSTSTTAVFGPARPADDELLSLATQPTRSHRRHSSQSSSSDSSSDDSDDKKKEEEEEEEE